MDRKPRYEVTLHLKDTRHASSGGGRVETIEVIEFQSLIAAKAVTDANTGTVALYGDVFDRETKKLIYRSQNND